MSQSPLVSVIVPNYNHALYLDQRFQSIFNQTYQNFEVIILDDCSSDNSIGIINKYKNDSHISSIILNEHNSGSPFIQWKKGIEIAKSNIIWIAESDDYCSPLFLDRVVKSWEKHPECAIVQTKSYYVNESGLILNPTIDHSNKEIIMTGDSAIRNHMICSNFYIPNASGVTFRKDLALSIPDNYLTYKASGDRLFWIYLLEKGSISIIDSPLNYFRQHSQNKVSSIREADGTQCKENYIINKYLHKRGFVKGIDRYKELCFYWNYIHSYSFKDENIRKELLNLWFPFIWHFKFLFRIKRKIFSMLPQVH